MATHSSILAWKISWTEEPGELQSWDHKQQDRTEHTMDGWDTDSQGSFTLFLSEILLSFALALLGIFSQDFIIILVLFSLMLFC